MRDSLRSLTRFHIVEPLNSTNGSEIMIWQSYENRSIIVLDEPMAEQLGHYLEKKESLLGRQILEVMLTLEHLPALEASASGLRLSDAVEEFGRKVQRISQIPSDQARQPDQWKFAARQISQALWSYVEILEGCVTELFQQINQVGFEQWDVDVVRAATSIKDELAHRMDDVSWAMRRLEQQLKSYRALCEVKEKDWLGIRRLSDLFSRLLDRSLGSTVRKCHKFLHFRYRQFVERYTGYLQLYDSSEKELRQCDRYPVLASLEIGQQQKIKQLYFLLKLWEKNCRALVLPKTEPIRALRSNQTFDGAIQLFKEYVASIQRAIFDQSRMIKQEFRLMFVDKESRQPLIDNLVNYRLELRALKNYLELYRKFHVDTDPGVKGWKRLFTRHPESNMPKQFRSLHILIKDIKNLENLAEGFQSSLEKEMVEDKTLTPKLQSDVNRHLHEMGQPLASKDLMRRNAKALLSSLENLDEIAAFDPKVVEFIGRTLCKAMCSDWKYHVLQELPSFHHVYQIHQGLFSLSGDRFHLNRLHKFQKILNRLDSWIQNHETLKHTQEVDLDVHDIKAYLQDFLAYVQRLEPEGESLWEHERFKRPVGEAVQALLEYLHLFGSFCSRLHRDDSEHRLVRKQLLFIDQYFEAIERRIQELYV